jgi:hypothetical protein
MRTAANAIAWSKNARSDCVNFPIRKQGANGESARIVAEAGDYGANASVFPQSADTRDNSFCLRLEHLTK